MEIPFGTYRHRFTAAGQQGEVVARATSKGLYSRLLLDGVEIAADQTVARGLAATRNHELATTLPDGAALAVTVGYVGWWSVGARADLNGTTIFESHPGRAIEFPKAMLKFVDQSDYDPARQKANLVPIMVDIAMGLVFFIVARMTDLTTAALVGAALGLALIGVQRFVKVDLIGGLALFGVIMLLVSAGFALLFNSGLAVQLRTVILGLISTAFFLFDGWRGGPWLGRGLSRYIPYSNLDTGKLAIGMGLLGAVMAAINLLFIWLASEDVWLFYTTFLDIPLIAGGFFYVMQRARRTAVA